MYPEIFIDVDFDIDLYRRYCYILFPCYFYIFNIQE